jgi:ribosomal protein S1
MCRPKFSVGSKHKVKVRNFTNFGIFVELTEGIDGLIHISDLSWTKNIRHPKDIVTKNQEVKVKILEVKHKVTISLGCRMFFVQDKSEICINPSIPSVNSTKIPKLVKFLTFTLCLEPTENFVSISLQGSGNICLIPRDIFLSCLSNVIIIASTSSPLLKKSLALLKCVDQNFQLALNIK